MKILVVVVVGVSYASLVLVFYLKKTRSTKPEDHSLSVSVIFKAAQLSFWHSYHTSSLNLIKVLREQSADRMFHLSVIEVRELHVANYT